MVSACHRQHRVFIKVCLIPCWAQMLFSVSGHNFNEFQAKTRLRQMWLTGSRNEERGFVVVAVMTQQQHHHWEVSWLNDCQEDDVIWLAQFVVRFDQPSWWWRWWGVCCYSNHSVLVVSSQKSTKTWRHLVCVLEILLRKKCWWILGTGFLVNN